MGLLFGNSTIKIVTHAVFFMHPANSKVLVKDKITVINLTLSRVSSKDGTGSLGSDCWKLYSVGCP